MYVLVRLIDSVTVNKLDLPCKFYSLTRKPKSRTSDNITGQFRQPQAHSSGMALASKRSKRRQHDLAQDKHKGEYDGFLDVMQCERATDTTIPQLI